MNDLILNIAGYILKFNYDINYNINYNITTSDRFRKFILKRIPQGINPDLNITVHPGIFGMKDPQEVFRASLPEGTEVAGGKSIPEFWSIVSDEGETFLRVCFPETDDTALMRFSIDANEWDLWISNHGENIDPLKYPLDGLILYYLSVARNDIMMHASGINIDGKGIIFSGISGKGKSTLASIFRELGADVIHDDRLILRRSAEGYTMYNTPVYPGEEPKESRVDRIFLIEHGAENIVTKLAGAQGMSRLMSNCMQHNWGHEIISRLLVSVNDLYSRMPVYKLAFLPDRNVVNYIFQDE